MRPPNAILMGKLGPLKATENISRGDCIGAHVGKLGMMGIGFAARDLISGELLDYQPGCNTADVIANQLDLIARMGSNADTS